MSTSDVPDISEIKRPRDMVPATERLMRKRGWLRKTPRAVTRYAKKYGMRREELHEATNRALSMTASGVVWDSDYVPPGSWAKVIAQANERAGFIPDQGAAEEEGNTIFDPDVSWAAKYLRPEDKNGLNQQPLDPERNDGDSTVVGGPPGQQNFGLEEVDTGGLPMPPRRRRDDEDEDDEYGPAAVQRERRRQASLHWRKAILATNARINRRGWARFSIS